MAEKAITKRRLMVEGSIWRASKAIEIHLWIDNPEIDRLIHERNLNSPSPHRHLPAQNGVAMIVLGGGVAQTPHQRSEVQRIQKLIDEAPGQIRIHAYTIPEGARLKVVGSPKPSGGYRKQTNGLVVGFDWLDGKENLWQSQLARKNHFYQTGEIKLPFNQIEAIFEAETIPETIVYVLRDRDTKEFYAGWQTEKLRGYNRQTNDVKMSATFSGSKKFKTLAAAKAGIMDFTGYHNDMEMETYVGEWIGSGNKKMDLPPSWEAVAIDKTTNIEKAVHDVQDWFANLMRLRVLTAKVSSVVRDVYRKVEGKPEYKTIVAFNLDPDLADDDRLEKADLDPIKEVMKLVETKTVKGTSALGRSFAVQDETDATLVALAYDGRLTLNLYDAHTLVEIVKDGQ